MTKRQALYLGLFCTMVLVGLVLLVKSTEITVWQVIVPLSIVVGCVIAVVRSRRQIQKLEQQSEFLLSQVAQLNEKWRCSLLGDTEREKVQTAQSFEYQWKNLPEGKDLPTDKQFMDQIKKQICELTQLPPEWFKGKKVLDMGCGIGRFSYGLLSLGAEVTACDISASAIERTKELCKKFSSSLKTIQLNVLTDEIVGEYDLAFSFGMVHHTGNTYLAMKKIADKVSRNGKLFMMIYGYPETNEDFSELNSYERLRRELRNQPFNDKVGALQSKVDASHVHGWFDAVSPRINDLLTYDEVEAFLTAHGFKNIKRPVGGRNLHLCADRSE